MIGKRNCRADSRRASDAYPDLWTLMCARRFWGGRSQSDAERPSHCRGFAFIARVLQSFDLRAELLFRSAEQKNGERYWSALKKYANPADIAYARSLADGIRSRRSRCRCFSMAT